MKTFLFLFCSNFDGRIINVILMHTLDSRCFFDVFLKEKKSWLLCNLLIDFGYFKKSSCFAVSFQCNLIPMYFTFKAISFHFEMSYVIMQYLRTVTPVNICYDQICPQAQWFSANIWWKFAGNGHRSHPFSLSCRFLKTFWGFFLFSNFKNRLLQKCFPSNFLSRRVLLHWN